MNLQKTDAQRAQNTVEQMVAFHNGNSTEWPKRADETHLVNFMASVVKVIELRDNTEDLNKVVRETWEKTMGKTPNE